MSIEYWKERVSNLKEQVSLRQVIDYFNIRCRSTGSVTQVHCPFHGKDKHASARIYETETMYYDADKVGFSEEDTNSYSSIGFDLFPVIGLILPVTEGMEITLNSRYNFVMSQAGASRLAVTAGFSFLLK